MLGHGLLRWLAKIVAPRRFQKPFEKLEFEKAILKGF
jgi:hypothetical protein